MSKPPIHNFHTRLPLDLKEVLDQTRGRKSLNREIVDRLRMAVELDEADQIADALRPLLASLSEAERAEFVTHAVKALELLARANPKLSTRNKSKISKS